MNRLALIISNPGEPGAENYCGGVTRDVVNYRSFLLSPVGGLWRAWEIVEMNRPTTEEVRRKVQGLSAYDYILVVFSGHGGHSITLDSTFIELRAGQEIDSAEFRLDATKQTIILDCCRRKFPGMPMVEARDMMKLSAAGPTINPTECRKYYDKRIEECPKELVVLYACGIDQLSADDDQRGGIYSHSLLEASKNWAINSTVDTSRTIDIRSVVNAHEAAVPLVQRARGARQTPHIEKPRTGPYYPFCVVA
jgi:hypothetical protein